MRDDACQTINYIHIERHTDHSSMSRFRPSVSRLPFLPTDSSAYDCPDCPQETIHGQTMQAKCSQYISASTAAPHLSDSKICMKKHTCDPKLWYHGMAWRRLSAWHVLCLAWHSACILRRMRSLGTTASMKGQCKNRIRIPSLAG